MIKVSHYKLKNEDMRIPELIEKGSIFVDYTLYDNTANIYKLCKNLLGIDQENDEEYILIPIDLSFQPLAVFLLKYYNVSSMKIYPKEVFTSILLTGAIGYYLVRYTPDVTLKVRTDEVEMCELINKLGLLFDLEFIDFVLINKNKYLSTKKEKLELLSNMTKK